MCKDLWNHLKSKPEWMLFQILYSLFRMLHIVYWMIIILLVHFLFFWLHNDLFWKSHRFHIIFHSKRSLERWSNTYPYMYNQKSFFMWSNRFKNGSYASTTVFPKLRPYFSTNPTFEIPLKNPTSQNPT